MSSKYNQNVLDHAKQSTTDTFKTASIKAIQKAAEATGDLIGNNIADRITGISKKSQKQFFIQKQLQMSMIKKYLTKDIHLQKKDRELLMASE